MHILIFSLKKLGKKVHYTQQKHNTSVLGLMTFQGLRNYTWLVAAVVDGTVLKFLLRLNAVSLLSQVGLLQSVKPSRPGVFFVGIF